VSDAPARSLGTGVPTPAKGRIVTFYSYKGGTGRSMAVANVAWVLALNGNRVLIIDWDLEAPGIHRYFHPFLEDKELQATEGLLHMVETLAAQAAASDHPLPADAVDIIDYIEPLEWPKWPKDTLPRVSWKAFGPRARIDLMPAGRQGPAYSRKLTSFNWVDFYEKLGGRGLLEAAKAQMRRIYDYVLIDSRTGVSDTSGICTVEMPDALVICFTLNDQSIRGAAAVAESVREQRRSHASAAVDGEAGTKSAGRDGFRIFPVPTRVEITSEREKREAALDLATETFSTFLTHIPADRQPKYWGSVQMAYFPFYAFEEIPAVFGDKPDEVLSLTTAVKEITRLISDPPLGDLPPLASDVATAESLRREILRSYLRRPARPAGDPVRVAQETFDQFDEQGKSEMLRVLLRLVVVGPTTEPSPRAVDLGELDTACQRMAQILAERRLLTVTETRGERSIGLSEPDLLQRWSLLKERVYADRRFLVWRLALAASADAWRQNRFDESALWRGKVLEEALTFERERRADLNDIELRFIEASRAAEQRRQESEERERSRVEVLVESLQKERVAFEKLRDEMAAGAGGTAGETSKEGETTGHDGPGLKPFGLAQNAWQKMPAAVRHDLYQWSQARRVGMIWLASAILICGFGIMTEFSYSFSRLSTPIYILIVVLAIAGLVVAPVLRRLARRFAVTSGTEGPSPQRYAHDGDQRPRVPADPAHVDRTSTPPRWSNTAEEWWGSSWTPSSGCERRRPGRSSDRFG